MFFFGRNKLEDSCRLAGGVCMYASVFFGWGLVPQPKTFMFSSVTDSKLPPGASPATPLRYGDGWMVYLCRSH